MSARVPSLPPARTLTRVRVHASSCVTRQHAHPQAHAQPCVRTRKPTRTVAHADLHDAAQLRLRPLEPRQRRSVAHSGHRSDRHATSRSDRRRLLAWFGLARLHACPFVCLFVCLFGCLLVGRSRVRLLLQCFALRADVSTGFSQRPISRVLPLSANGAEFVCFGDVQVGVGA